MFRVIAPNINEEFDRWTDALNRAKSLMPQCKSLFVDIRIYHKEYLLWIYSRSHKYPQYIGAGTYDRLAKLFLIEASEEETTKSP
jgi:hypothetical protein